MTDYDHRKHLTEGLACITLLCLFAFAAPTSFAPPGNTASDIDNTPVEDLQTRRYRFRLLPLETGDRHILLA